jgi:hypothetical protein
MIRKGQVRWVAGDDLLRQIQFIDSLFDLAPKNARQALGDILVCI